MSAQWILLVLEDGIIPSESIGYAIKLAKRIDCSVSVLMLTLNSTGQFQVHGTDEEDIMQQAINMITAAGLNARVNYGYGDKASEFLKHLALNPSLSAIVWGGGENIVTGQKRKKGDHWFEKVKSSVRCPVVRAAIKEKHEKQLQRKEKK